MNRPDRSSVLFINSIAPEQPQAVKRLEEILGRPIRSILLRDPKNEDPAGTAELEPVIQLLVDFDDPKALQQTIAPYADDILVVTCKDDASAAFLKHLIPHVPHLVLPRPETLAWATEKTKMRARFQLADTAISPKFMLADDASQLTILRIERTIGYPLIVKPSGLTSSLFITVCENRDELETALEQIMQNIAPRYQGKTSRKPEVLVEEFMDSGTYFSMDVYVGSAGQTWFAPPVYGKTGRDIGFDDCFGYMRATPTYLRPEQIKACEAAAATAVKALNLRSTTCHVELMLTPDGWKIIELGPRIGGFRHELYSHAFGINHTLNDLLVRMGAEPIIPKEQLGYSAMMQFYPHQEGELLSIRGLDKVEKLGSIKRLTVLKHEGDACLFASHGGSHVLEVVLFNADLAQLVADIHAIEQSLEIQTKPRPNGTMLYQSRLTV